MKYLRTHLSAKLFFSYLVVIVLGMGIMVFSVRVATQRRIENMAPMMQQMMGNRPDRPHSGQQLKVSFLIAINDSLILASIISFGIALFASGIISRQVVEPVREMMKASQRVAEGHYQERVNTRVNPSGFEEEGDELSQLAVSFNQMAEKLEQIESTRRQLIGDVAHELRTPLTAIKGSMEGLMDGILSPNEETYQQIYQEAERLERLVNDLQELSRVESRAYELHVAPVPVSNFIQTVSKRLSRSFADKNIGLEVDLAPQLPDVMVDEDRIGQVMMNLVANALLYTPEGGQVRIEGRQREQEVLISVRDTGVGIPADDLSRIFDRFYRVDKSRCRVHGGSGIGLTIAKYLVEAHGGKIWAESPGENQGSTFFFTLPACQNAEMVSSQ